MTPAELDDIAAMLAATTGGAEGDWVAHFVDPVLTADNEGFWWVGTASGPDTARGVAATMTGSAAGVEAGDNAAWIAASKSAARRLLALARECLLLRRIFAADFCHDTDIGKDALALAVREGRRQMRAEAADEAAAKLKGILPPIHAAIVVDALNDLPDAPPEEGGAK